MSFPLKNSTDISINVQKNTNNEPIKSKEKIRVLFDSIALNVITFLEKHRAITDVKFFERAPITNKQIEQWETENGPYRLPEDYKTFLMISDGFTLKWHMKFNGDSLHLGTLSLSSLTTVTAIQHKGIKQVAFQLDASNDSTDGVIAMVFEEIDAKHNNDSNENNVLQLSIWFQDLSCEWHYVCASFTDYFRLMIMHLGLKNWQYAFTKIGLNAVTRQWLRFLMPLRCDMDMRHNENGFGWVLHRENEKKNKQPKQIKRKKLNLNKIDQIVAAQLSKANSKDNKVGCSNTVSESQGSIRRSKDDTDKNSGNQNRPSSVSRNRNKKKLRGN